MKRKEVRKIMLKSALLGVLILTMILGLNIVPLRACEYSLEQDVVNTVFDPSDDIHCEENVLKL